MIRDTGADLDWFGEGIHFLKVDKGKKLGLSVKTRKS